MYLLTYLLTYLIRLLHGLCVTHCLVDCAHMGITVALLAMVLWGHVPYQVFTFIFPRFSHLPEAIYQNGRAQDKRGTNVNNATPLQSKIRDNVN